MCFRSQPEALFPLINNGDTVETIMSVTGAIRRKDLGVTTTHEHIFLDLSGFYTDHPVPGCDSPGTEKVRMDNLGILSRDPYAIKDNLFLLDYETQKKEITFFRDAGGKTVVDASLPGIGRDAEALKRISEETGLNVIMGTGYYVGDTHPAYLKTMTDREVADLMVKALTKGVEGTGIRAGYIGEIGISEKFDDKERAVLRAAAIAQRDTGVAVNVHINPWTTNGLEASDILIHGGVDPSRICISHVDVENREDYIYGLLNKGVFIEFDNFGKEYYVRREVRNSGYGLFVRDTERVSLLKKLIDDGYEKQIVLSCDVCLKNLLHTYGGWGYDHVLTNIVPMMEDEGITSEQIEALLCRNPADFLFGRN